MINNETFCRGCFFDKIKKKKQNSTNLELKGVTVSSVAKVSVPDSAVFYILLSEGHSGGEALVICE